MAGDPARRRGWGGLAGFALRPALAAHMHGELMASRPPARASWAALAGYVVAWLGGRHRLAPDHPAPRLRHTLETLASRQRAALRRRERPVMDIEQIQPLGPTPWPKIVRRRYARRGRPDAAHGAEDENGRRRSRRGRRRRPAAHRRACLRTPHLEGSMKISL